MILPTSIPFFPTVGIKVTSLCNMKCNFCCEPQRTRPAYELSSYKQLLEIIARAGGKKICITGGEPLLYPEIFEFIRFSRSLGLANVLLCADGARFISSNLESSPSDTVRFSVHGLNDTHNAIVGEPEAFNNIEKAIDKAINNNWKASVTTVVTKKNTDQLEQMAEWCIDRGVSKYYLFGIMKSGNGARYIIRNGSVNNELCNIAIKLRQKYAGTPLEIITHSYEQNAECIIMYGDGEVIVDPYHATPPYQKRIGNIFVDGPHRIFENVLSDPDLSEDYLSRLGRSGYL